MFATRLGSSTAAIGTFSASDSWQAHHVSFEEIGLDGTDITAIAFCAGPEPGPFAFSLDDVALDPSPRAVR